MFYPTKKPKEANDVTEPTISNSKPKKSDMVCVSSFSHSEVPIHWRWSPCGTGACGIGARNQSHFYLCLETVDLWKLHDSLIWQWLKIMVPMTLNEMIMFSRKTIHFGG